jgi:putative transposase
MAKYKIYRPESHRWQLWDYSSPASYFITICTANKKHLFGKIEDGEMILSDLGRIVANEFEKLPAYHQRIVLDEYIVMPNHLHCIITLQGDDFDNGIAERRPTNYVNTERHIKNWVNPTEPPEVSDAAIKLYQQQRRLMLIPKIIGKFKQQTSKQINIVNPTPEKDNWQLDYHDHVIRNLTEYWKIRNYIINNPKRWNEDIHFE